jgi:hypothetical protein
MQSLLWDRRLVLAILDHIGVPTPRRAEVSRDGGPRVPSRLRERVRRDLGMVLPGPLAEGEEAWGPVVVPDRWKGRKIDQKVPKAKEVVLTEDGDAIIVGDTVVMKPFVEKPVDGEDHNVYIYYKGGGGRRLFRKVIFGMLELGKRCVCHADFRSQRRLETSPVNTILISFIREQTVRSSTRNSSMWTMVSMPEPLP